jgi:hypothetical protein
MRADMAKVIVECPRVGSRIRGKPKGFRRSLQRQGQHDGPIREGMKRRCRGGSKWLNEHLGPLRRYLDRQVGRPWDNVFSEICAHINRSSAVQDHVRDHGENYVTTHVLLIDGVPCNGDGGWHHGKPLHELRYRPWFVCPSTGLLRRVKVASRKRQRPPQEESPPPFIPLGDGLQCRYVEDAWHLVTLKPLPDLSYHLGRCRAVDVLLNRPVCEITPDEARRHYGAAVYAAAVRRLARKELRQFPIPARWWG